ncbi:MAG: hypothetical protein WA419_14425 [Silvibacterium sp.]
MANFIDKKPKRRTEYTEYTEELETINSGMENTISRRGFLIKHPHETGRIRISFSQIAPPIEESRIVVEGWNIKQSEI